MVVFDVNILANITLMGKNKKYHKNQTLELWNTDTPAIVSYEADLTETPCIFQWILERKFMYFFFNFCMKDSLNDRACIWLLLYVTEYLL